VIDAHACLYKSHCLQYNDRMPRHHIVQSRVVAVAKFNAVDAMCMLS
jgi:hypothetical protein